jgi:hypothetical protein
MRTAIALSTICVFSSFVRADQAKTPPQAPPPPADTALSESSKMLDPIQVDSLTLTPIISTDAKPDKSSMIVLDEAMPKKLVRIHEIDAGKQVNSLTLTNNSNDPLFLLAGEVIIGGEQDRIIGRNTIIPAKTTQEVPVFCVEAGRWEGKTKEFTSAKALAHGRLRGQASYAAQTEVWAEVHTKNEKRKTTSDTDTYRTVAAQASDGTLGGMEKRVDAALAKLPDEDKSKLVGFAVSLNGKVATVDVFGSPALFAKLQNKLVKSYLNEAIDIAAEKNVKPPTAADVKTFISDTAKDKEERSYETKAAKTYVKKGGRSSKASVKVDDSPSAKPVYENYQSK